MSWWQWILTLVVIAFLALLMSQWPSLVRYVRIKRM